MSMVAVNSVNTIDPMSVPVGSVVDLLTYGVTLVFGEFRLVPDLEEQCVEVQAAENDSTTPWTSVYIRDLNFDGVLWALKEMSLEMKGA